MKLNVNLKKMVSLRGVALALVLTGSVTCLTGCGEKAECDVRGNHAHMYQNETGYIRYIDKEYLRYEGYDRQEEYVVIGDSEDLYKFLDKKNLLRIDDNLELIKQVQEQNQDYMEYRYRYTHLQPIPHVRSNGKTTSTYFTYIPVTRYSWTDNPNHSRLTGETRMCHHVYQAYDIAKDDKGKYVLIASDKVDDITTVMDEYPYIKEKYCVIVTLDGQEADYEDGKQEDLTPEERERAEKYEAENNVEYQNSDEQLNDQPKTLKKLNNN